MKQEWITKANQKRVDLISRTKGMLLWKQNVYEVVRLYNTTEVDIGDVLNKEQLLELNKSETVFIIYQEYNQQRKK